jgi:hypothetical protein
VPVIALFKGIGTAQQKLTGVKSGIKQKLMIWAWAAWGLFYILRGLGVLMTFHVA